MNPAPERNRTMISSILVPLDGSPLAEQVLPPVVQLAHGLGAPVTLLTAISAGAVAAGRPPEYRATFDQIVSAEAEKARAYLAKQRARLEAQGVEAQTRVAVVGHVAEAIAEHAREHAFGLIAMSTHGRTGLTRWVMGSVADGVLHRSAVPLLLLRPREGGEPTAFRHVLLPLDQSPSAEALARRLDLPLTLVHVQVLAQICFDEAACGGGSSPYYAELEHDLEQAASAYLDGQAEALRRR